MGGYAENTAAHPGADRASRLIVLSDVDAIGADSGGQLHVIIDDERHAGAAAGGLQLKGERKLRLSFQRARALLAELDHRRPSA
ncbi:hypothetical protein D3C77_414770 [compost metagenome]